MTVNEKMARWHDRHAAAFPNGHTMRESHKQSASALRGEPIKLSRERWELLVFGVPLAAIKEDGSRSIDVTKPTELDGVIFLPATYVPA